MLFMHNVTPLPYQKYLFSISTFLSNTCMGIVTLLFHALFSSSEFDGTPPCYIMHAFSYEPQNP
jgi:hypothetical protein